MNKINIKSKLVAGALLITTLAYTSPVLAYTKSETVYSKNNNEGENYKTTVSTHLKNDENEKLLEDITNLLNIQNTNGNQTFEQDGNKLIWKAEGEDIYYQGDTKKELPITSTIKYTLNGKEIKAEELAGKKGKVTIEITYLNHEKHIVQINGTKTTLYTPFLVLAGTVINNENNKNITINNGKVINDGTKTIVVGMTMPGMKESLNTSNNIMDLSDTIKITMETKDFELNNIITIATPKIIQKEDFKMLDKLDEIYNKVNTLKSASNEIEKGANTLKEGTDTYYEKSKEFNKAVGSLSKGTSKANGAYTELNQGIANLNANSNILNAGAKKLDLGAKQVTNGLATVKSNMSQLETGSQVLSSGISKVQGGVNSLKTEVDNTLKEAMSPEKQNEISNIKQIISNNEKILKSAGNSVVTDSNLKQLYVTNEALKQTLQTIIDSQSKIKELNNGLAQIQSGINGNDKTQGLVTGSKQVSEGITKLKKEGLEPLISGSSDLANGANQLYKGTSSLQTGTATLKNGSNEIQKGLSELNNSTAQLLNANNQLTEGAKTIKTGAKDLSDGINKFNREGITPICNFVNGNLKNTTTRVDKLIDLSENYQSFTTIKDGEEGNVKFIMMTDSIKKKDNKEEAIITDTNITERKEENK